MRVKAHVGLFSNDMADRLAKYATTDRKLQKLQDKIPKSVISRELTEDSIAKWEIEWSVTNNGQVTKSFSQCVRDRLKTKFKMTSNFTIILS